MAITTHELCSLAAELAAEHGVVAGEYARQASASCEAEGAMDRAQFWFMLSVLLDDIALHRIDPERIPTIQ